MTLNQNVSWVTSRILKERLAWKSPWKGLDTTFRLEFRSHHVAFDFIDARFWDTIYIVHWHNLSIHGQHGHWHWGSLRLSYITNSFRCSMILSNTWEAHWQHYLRHWHIHLHLSVWVPHLRLCCRCCSGHLQFGRQCHQRYCVWHRELRLMLAPWFTCTGASP